MSAAVRGFPIHCPTSYSSIVCDEGVRKSLIIMNPQSQFNKILNCFTRVQEYIKSVNIQMKELEYKRKTQTPEAAVNRHLKYLLKRGKADSNCLLEFCEKMPKIELHNHLAGSIYPLTYINFAAEKNFFIDLKERKFFQDDSNERIPVRSLINNPSNSVYLDALIKSMSADVEKIYAKNCGASVTEVAQSFFDAFQPGDSLTDTWLMQLYAQLKPCLNEAERQNVLYTEFMKGIWTGETPKEVCECFSKEIEYASTISSKIGSVISFIEKTGYLTVPECEAIKSEWNFSAAWNELNKSTFIKDYADSFIKKINDAHLTLTKDNPNYPKHRFIAQVCRHRSDQEFFTDMVAAMTIVLKSDKVVGVTIAGREDEAFAALHFKTQMRMINYIFYKIHGKKIAEISDKEGVELIPAGRQVKLTLHAGEFTHQSMLKVASPSDHNHVGDSIVLGHASRIGHGVTMNSVEREILLKSNVAIEICASSNHNILGIEIEHQPELNRLNESNVDISINTDDAAINRTTISFEWMKVITAFQWSWQDIKNILRGTAQHTFLSGDSIYQKVNGKYEIKQEFRSIINHLDENAQKIMNASEKACLQIELERSFIAFENFIVKKIKTIVQNRMLL